MKHILETKHEEKNFRCAVIVNDMAALNIDKSLIDQSALVQSDEVIAMQNGCFCCTLQNDLVDQIIALSEKKLFNYMLIEASGVSEPSQIAPLFDLCDDEYDPDDPEADHDHCGGPGLSQVQVLQCDRLEGPGTSWRCVAVSGQEDKTSNTAVYVDSGMCQLVTERLAAFALVAQASELGGGRSAATSSSGCSSLGSTPATDNAPFRIPLHVKQELAGLLDPAQAGQADWRELAERLGVTRYTAFFSTQPSPTEAILNLWEARNRESTAVAGLVNTLRGMARHDAAQVLDMDTSWP